MKRGTPEKGDLYVYLLFPTLAAPIVDDASKHPIDEGGHWADYLLAFFVANIIIVQFKLTIPFCTTTWNNWIYNIVYIYFIGIEMTDWNRTF